MNDLNLTMLKFKSMKDYSTTRKLRCPSAGVYLTTMDPGANNQTVIARNNYSKRWQEALKDGKVDCAFRLRIAKDRVKNCSAGGRNVYLFTGNLYLKDYTYIVVALGTGGCLPPTDSDPPSSNQVVRRAYSAIICLCMLGLFVFA